MKKFIIALISVLIIILCICYFVPSFAPSKENDSSSESTTGNQINTENGANQESNGNTNSNESEDNKLSSTQSDKWLHVDGTSIKNNKNEIVTLKGISSHGVQWFSDLITYNNLKTLKDTWGINVFRIAMYTDENGYISNKEPIKQKVIEIANNVISLDMYVIIDWHILKDNDPNIYKEDSKAFFDEISLLYKDSPNVIYEICNEPNGNNVTWNGQVKPYAEEIIPIIRKNSPKSLIIVGTPNWCQDLEAPSNSPLNFENVLYACHFYAGTHKESLRQEVSKALEKGLPIIVSEWGTTDASGSGTVDIEESKKWIDFLNSKNISFINWSLSNKDESSAILNKNFPASTNSNNSSSLNSTEQNPSSDSSLNSYQNSEASKNSEPNLNDYLTESGKFVKSIINF